MMDTSRRFLLVHVLPELLGSAVIRGVVSGCLTGFMLFFFLPEAGPVSSGLWRDYRLLPMALSVVFLLFFLFLLALFGFMASCFHRKAGWIAAFPRVAGLISGSASYIYILQIWRWCWLERPGAGRFTGAVVLSFLCIFSASVITGRLGFGLVNKIRVLYQPPGIRSGPPAAGRSRYVLFILALFCFVLYILYARYGPFPAAPIPEENVPHKKTPPLLVIGMDGVESDMIRTLIGMGQLPAFQRFLEKGRCYLTSPVTPRDPLLVWNAIACGYNVLWNDVFYLNRDYFPRRHFGSWPGHKALTVAFPPLKFTSLRPLREMAGGQKSFWEIGAEKKKVLSVNWRGSWPVGPLPGTIISDMTYPALVKNKKARGFASPPEVEDELRKRFDTDWRPGSSSLSLYLPDLLGWEMRRVINGTTAVDDYYARICLRYMQRKDYECIILYLHGLEVLKYFFLADRERLSVSDLYARVEILKSYYIFLDIWLDRLMKQFDQNGHVVLIGDPGRIAVQGDYLAAGWFGCMGPGIRPGGIAGYIKELAATPTIVTLMGIPPTEQMEEESPEDAFREPFITGIEGMTEVPSYGPRHFNPRISPKDMEDYLRRELTTPAYALWK